MILRCSCKHEFQDERYGRGMRVHNPCSDKGPRSGQATCTVCGVARYISSATPALKDRRKKKQAKDKGKKK